MYSPVDGYRCTATAVAAANRRERPQCNMAAAAGLMLFHTHAHTAVESVRNVEWRQQQQQQVRCCFTQSRLERSQCRMAATAAAAGPMLFHTEPSRAFAM